MGSSQGCCANDINKSKGFNSQQKLSEIKAYRIFLSNLFQTMRVTDGVISSNLYFIKKKWMESWYKYTNYIKIASTLEEYEINNQLDFDKLILDKKKASDFNIFYEKDKPDKLEFFEIATMHSNIQSSFYILDKKTVDFFNENYKTDYDYNKNKDSVSLECEVGKGRILFNVGNEYLLIIYLNQKNELKQSAMIFETPEQLKKFYGDIKGRALTSISKEIKKFVSKNGSIFYKRDEVCIYDDRKFTKEHKDLYIKDEEKEKKIDEGVQRINIKKKK